ncbi:MAG: ATP-binding protein [Bacteroidales bacterium]|nr:ATP-binding protein [Bacteroidales bacterium]
MYRKIIERLKEWKTSDDRKPLVLLGARQVGKTWLMKEFGQTCYDSMAYLNCDNEPLAKDLFNADYNIPRILLAIQAITGVKVEPGRTLIVIDEIQEVQRGLHSLKYFCENAPEYHVVAAGSLLGVTLGQKESFPVGKVNMLQVQPMDFEEFMIATGHQNLLDSMRQGDWSLLDMLDAKYQELLRQYYFVGGMPEAVKQYVLHQDLKQVRTIQSEIMESYRKDIAKHATKAEAVRITQVLDTIVSQLTKENKKFIYGVIKKGARAAQYELAIQWLIDAGIVYKVPRVSAIKMPLKAYEDAGAFKLFLLDCGLFGLLADAPANLVLTSNNIFKEYKGAFTEQYVFQQLSALNIHPHYWSNDGTPAEIDFVIQAEGRPIPIEVKAEENVRAKSMSEYIKNHPDDQLKGLRISMREYVNQDWMENIPLYAIAKYMSNVK